MTCHRLTTDILFFLLESALLYLACTPYQATYFAVIWFTRQRRGVTVSELLLPNAMCFVT
jgi:hypothetical protein